MCDGVIVDAFDGVWNVRWSLVVGLLGGCWLEWSFGWVAIGLFCWLCWRSI